MPTAFIHDLPVAGRSQRSRFEECRSEPAESSGVSKRMTVGGSEQSPELYHRRGVDGALDRLLPGVYAEMICVGWWRMGKKLHVGGRDVPAEEGETVMAVDMFLRIDSI